METVNIPLPANVHLFGKANFSQWPIDCLANYIEKKMKLTLLDADKAMEEIAKQENKLNLCLRQIRKDLSEFIFNCFAHHKKEEQLLRPLIAEMVQYKEQNLLRKNIKAFYQVDDLVFALDQEHAMQNAELTRTGISIKDFSGTQQETWQYKKLFTLFADFEKNIQLHTYMQSKELFPTLVLMKYTAV
jgi:iron-sulfur cluster repair protein YtfE (RIC family)